MRLHHSLFFVVAIAGTSLAQNVAPISTRLTAQNALFEEQYQSDLRNFPERATAFGDYRYNDKLAEYSLQAIGERHKTDQGFLTRLEAIPTSGFSEQDKLSHDLLDVATLVEGGNDQREPNGGPRRRPGGDTERPRRYGEEVPGSR